MASKKKAKFDILGFMAAVMECAKAYRMTSIDVADEVGLPARHVRAAEQGSHDASAAFVAALGDWAGVDPRQFAVLE